MGCRIPSQVEVAEAASAIYSALERADKDRYFSLFAADASFVFHPKPARMNSRAEYREAWSEWVDGLLECVSTDPLIQTFPGGAVFSNTVFTRVRRGDVEMSDRQRESIVFRVDGDQLLAVHEHLSPFAQT